jgi:hypothetical protein
MADLKEQHICVKICFKLGKTALETHLMLKIAFGDNATGRTQTFSRFKRGETSAEDSERSGRPLTGRADENVKNVRKIFNEDRRNTITETAGRLGPSYGTCQRIMRISGAHCFVCAAIFGRYNMAVVPHPPHSPDLAPCDFFLFPRMKVKLKRGCFQDANEIQEQSMTVLHAIPKSQFQRCFQQWHKRWTRCINSEGDSNE